jgi:GTPase SAR1 family protein
MQRNPEDETASSWSATALSYEMLEISEGRSNTMTTESIEQMKARLKREDEEKEETFQKRLHEIKESQAPWRAKREAKERTEEQERQKLHEDLRQKREQEMKDSALRSWLDAGGGPKSSRRSGLV